MQNVSINGTQKVFNVFFAQKAIDKGSDSAKMKT